MWFCIVCITAVVREARVEKKKTVVCVIVLANRTGRHVTHHWDLQLDGMKIKYCKFNHAMH